jgi:hypothetical protein
MNYKASEQITGLIHDQDLAFKFIAVYSRFEYALKDTGFLTIRSAKLGKKVLAEVDRDAFADSVSSDLFAEAPDEFNIAFIYILNCPPPTQVVNRMGLLNWRPTLRKPFESDARFLLRLVSMIRGNLFEGGKYLKKTAGGDQLLRSGLIVVQRCLLVDQKLKKSFEEIS